ncbi:MAG TPA: pyridoxal phosphate-dependent aminotransferase [Gemmatimonadaceae bacterium]|nr:pyridoxal phosphate-dependent aminotransferase [Gemmatimonadaceae bacterium]
MTETATLRTFAPSANVSFLKESATIAVSARARALKAQGRKVIDLGAGEPDFDTPEFIRRAAQRAIDAGATKYTATEGIMPLREAIAAEASARWGGDRITASEVVVSNGSKQSLFNACFTLFGEGDEVLIPTPSWTSYYEMVALSRAKPVAVIGDPQNGLKVTAAFLDAASTPRTAGVMLNSPCNPTGAVYSESELREIMELADERDWWVLSDEIYRRISYNGPVASVLDLATKRDRLIVIDGVAKAYAMTGWRIGWTIAPRAVSAAMGALQSHTTSNAAAVSQHAALEAITNVSEAEKAIALMVSEFHARRDAVVKEARVAAGLPFVYPEGAFYLYANVATKQGGDGTAFAAALLEQHEAAIVPGAAFFTPDWVRLSYAAPREQVIAGVQRLVQLYQSFGG